MIKLRKGTFETNSSSTHSIVLMLEDEYQQYINHKLFLDEDGDLHTRAEILDEVREYLTNEVDEEDFDDCCSSEKFTLEYVKEHIDIIDSEYFADIVDWLNYRWDFDYHSCDKESDLEKDKTHATLSDGTKVVAICEYGNNY